MTTERAPSHHESSNGIDWEEIHENLQRTAETLARGAAPDADEKRAILRTRARELAREPQQARLADDTLETIQFSLAAETYAIELAYVREVYPMKDYTPVPCTPPFVVGIVNVRGQILSVVDLKKFLGLPHRGIGELNKIIIIRDDRMEFGILADVVLGTVSVPLNEIQSLPAGTTGIGGEFLKGVTVERVILLDAAGILADQSMVVREEEGQGA